MRLLLGVQGRPPKLLVLVLQLLLHAGCELCVLMHLLLLLLLLEVILLLLLLLMLRRSAHTGNGACSTERGMASSKAAFWWARGAGARGQWTWGAVLEAVCPVGAVRSAMGGTFQARTWGPPAAVPDAAVFLLRRDRQGFGRRAAAFWAAGGSGGGGAPDRCGYRLAVRLPGCSSSACRRPATAGTAAACAGRVRHRGWRRLAAVAAPDATGLAGRRWQVRTCAHGQPCSTCIA